MKLDQLITDSLLPIFDSFSLSVEDHPNDLDCKTLYADSDDLIIWIDYNPEGKRYEMWFRCKLTDLDWMCNPKSDGWEWYNGLLEVPEQYVNIAETIIGHRPIQK